MDVELVTEGISEDESFRLDDNNEDYTNFEGERCGICMDIVIDRGVLDCCQHWFCFTCIDNWATITNLCPLCQNEFQSITCVPVYDTIGGNKTDEDSNSRDDDWSIEGKNSTLSFPSYYIDENAVVCLDGDGCKIRSGSATIETDPNLDTSIACDSCDIWYHAFCVGFDPEGACENSWLCPRCIVEQVPKRSDGVPVSRPYNQHAAETVSGDCSVEAAFSGKLSVSVADAGETAVVVSIVEENLGYEKLGGQVSNLDVGEGTKFDAFSSSSAAAAPKSGELSSERISCEPNSMSEELELSLSRSIYSSLPLHSTLLTNVKINTDDKGTEESELINGLRVGSSAKSSATPFNDKLLESGLDLDLGLSVSSSSDADMINNTAEDQMPGYVEQKSLGNLLSAKETMPDQDEMLPVSMMPDKKGNDALIAVAKRKHEDTSADDGESKAKIDSKISLKKVKVEGNSDLMYLKDQYIDSVPDDSKTLSAVTDVTDSGSKSAFEKENGTTNIMDIVRETGRRRLKELDHTNSATMSSKERENAVGLRMKKIMKRTGDDVDSSMLVQKLRKEIREAVRNRSSKDIGENLFDPDLLAAFRAVVAGPVNEPKKPPVDMKAKKALLQKGKVRENLTKKIYAIGGRRRRAWTRDCEIEFWKHRCSKISKPEKIQTLKLVLDLLRNDTDKTVVKHEREGDTTGSILSRLYLADTSVFPRKYDIKPVSALKDVAIPEQNKEHGIPQKSEKISPRNEVSTKIVTLPLSGSKLTKKSVLGLKGETASSKLHQNKCSVGPSISKAGSSKSPSNQEMVGMSDGIKSDKRKWALELLARKTAVAEKNAVHEKEEDSAMLKGNYPLLAQLPKDMRPVLEPIRHNKIPTAVRQAQLYRLAEHLLRKANLPAMRRTAETELAIADATNIEREIADRSNSKLVYVNLCSQELLRRSENTSASRATETNLSSTSVDHADGDDVTNVSCSDMGANEALKAAGLLSDTPPGSPHQPSEEIKEDAGFLNKIEEDDGPDNVFEIDSQPEFDIYGDFEYNMEDDDFIGASALKISKLQPEESKMKVVFSTVNVDKSDVTPDTPNDEASASIEASKVSSGLCECGAITGSSIEDGRTNDTLPQNSVVDEECEEPSLAECEELYGPDKEPLFKRYPETALMKPYEVIASEEFGNKTSCETVEASDPQSESCTVNIKVTNGDQCTVSEDSSGHSKKIEDAQRKEKNSSANANKQSNGCNFVSKKVEAYIKEHIRPLCKSGVITVEQYRWAVGKTTEKVMKYHSKDKNANFLVKEGEKVKKLAEQYVEAAQQTAKS